MSNREDKDNFNKLKVLMMYRNLVNNSKTIARMGGRVDGNAMYNEIIENLARLNLRCTHRFILPSQLKAEKERLKEYAHEILKCAYNYIQYSKFNNNYTNAMLLKSFNDKCEELAVYLNVNPSYACEDRIEEEDFLKNIKNPLTDDNIKRFVELFYLGDEDDSFYGRLMVENSCQDELSSEAYRAMRKNIFVHEIERMLEGDEKRHVKTARGFQIKYIINELLIPYYIITGNKDVYYDNKERYSLGKKNIAPDLKFLVDKYGVNYIVDKYNEIRSQLENSEKRQYSLEERKIYWTIDYIRRATHNFPGILSFFINREMFDDKAICRTDNATHVRFYINVGADDIYKFTDEFVKLAIDAGIPIDIKVVDAEKKESERAERLVIYSNFETMQQNLDILRKIKKKYPNFKYGNPPITTATIDEWIGFGSEPKSQYSSYNSDRAKLLANAIMDVFGKRGSEEDGKKIMKRLDEQPELLNKLRAKIIELSESYGVSKKYFFLDKYDEEYFENRKSRYIFSEKCSQVIDYGFDPRKVETTRVNVKSTDEREVG